MIGLPRFTFLNGPKGSGKTSIARLLSGEDSALMSFASPLRNALLASFYPDELHEGKDLTREEVKAQTFPGTGVTHRRFMIEYGRFLKTLFNHPGIIGDLGRRSCEAVDQYYPRFIFDDARTIDDVATFSLAYNPENCLLIHLYREGCSWETEEVGQDLVTIPGFTHIAATNNGLIEETLAFISEQIELNKNRLRLIP